jgi:hypothetical protein
MENKIHERYFHFLERDKPDRSITLVDLRYFNKQHFFNSYDDADIRNDAYYGNLKTEIWIKMKTPVTRGFISIIQYSYLLHLQYLVKSKFFHMIRRKTLFCWI